jgi:hypothetical protein
MKKTTISLLVSSIALVPMAFAETSFTDAIKGGEAHLKLRLRYEDVDQGNPIDKDAQALTLRTRLNYKTANFKGFTGFVEMDDVSAIVDDYNSTTNGNGDDAVIADPEGTEVNQAWANYNNWDTDFKYGRQRILLDNQRFVGGVGFRQNEQTYDAFSVTNKSLPDTTIFAANISNVNRIFGEDSAAGNSKSNTNLINAKYSGFSAGTVTGYAYLIDDKDVARFSTDTYGVRFNGKAGEWIYTLEYATQSDSKKNTANYDADYILADVAYTISDVKLKLSYEQLGSDNGAAFITPLATLHAFQGWADQFLVTPSEGLTDLALSASTKIAGLKLLAIYHNFESDTDNAAGDSDLGSELNFLVAKKWGGYGLSLKYARYSKGDSSFNKSDTDKLWLTATANF